MIGENQGQGTRMDDTVHVHVREAVGGDVEAAVELWTLSHVARRNGRPLPEAHIVLARQRLSSPEGMVLLAASGATGAELIGTVIAVQGLGLDGQGPPVPGLLHISMLSVAPDRWGQHVGRLLVEEVLDRAASDGFTEAQLWTHADNLRANRLYRAMGFRRSGRVRVDDWGELLVHYRRLLATAQQTGPLLP